MYKRQFTAWNIRKNEKRQPGQVQAYKRKRKGAGLDADAELATILQRRSNTMLPVAMSTDHATMSPSETIQRQRSYPDIPQQEALQARNYEQGQRDDHNATALASHNTRWSDLAKTDPENSRLQQFWNPDINSFSGSTDHDKQEGCLLMIRDYITSALDSFLWHFTPHCPSSKESNGFTDDALNSFIGHGDAADDLYNKGELAGAELELVNSSACIGPLITSEDPRILHRMLQKVYRSHYFYTGSKMVLEQFADMASIILGTMHPLTRISLYLGLMMSTSTESQLDYSISIMLEAAVGQLSRHLGPVHTRVLDFRLDYLKLFPDSPETPNLASALMRDCELHLHRSETDYFNVQIGVGWYHYAQERFPEARAITYDVLDTVKYFNHPEVRLLERSALELLAYVNNTLGNVHAAEKIYHKFLSLIVSEYGESSSTYTQCLIILEEWYTEWGMIEKALAVSEKRVELQLSKMKLV